MLLGPICQEVSVGTRTVMLLVPDWISSFFFFKQLTNAVLVKVQAENAQLLGEGEALGCQKMDLKTFESSP
jgi:hypothetical protein